MFHIVGSYEGACCLPVLGSHMADPTLISVFDGKTRRLLASVIEMPSGPVHWPCVHWQC